MRKKCSVIWNQTLFFFFLLILNIPLNAQNDIKLMGIVRSTDGGPLSGVSIKLDGVNVVGASDDEGKFVIRVPNVCTLTFSSVGYKSQHIGIRGQRSLVVLLENDVISLNEVLITQSINDKLTVEPTKVESDKRFLIVNTRYKVPEKFFTSHTRLIIQPYMVKLSAPDIIYMMHPVVCDGADFAIRQARMYGDMRQDPLYTYITPLSSLQNGYISYSDSLEVENMDVDYHTYTKAFIETCCDVVYRDTILVSKGVVNPLKLIDLHYDPVMWNTENAPAREIMLREEKGAIDLSFNIKSAVIDENIANNKTELLKIQDRLQQIENTPGSVLQIVEMDCSASPDGFYSSNKRLAKRRVQSSMEFLTSRLRSDTRRGLIMRAEANVAEWTEVAAMLRKDGYSKEAHQIERLCRRYASDRDLLSSAIRYQPFYKLIAGTYLPLFRQVQYKLTYSINRELSDEEVSELFHSDQLSLTQYEYWRYFRILYNKPASEYKKEELEEQRHYLTGMLKLFPKSVWAANNLAALNLLLNEPDPNILAAFCEDPDIAEDVYINQILTFLKLSRIKDARRLSESLSSNDQSNYIRSLIGIQEERYEEALGFLKHQTCLNKVVLLLKLKRNDLAYMEAKNLTSGTAKEFYIKAICANRLNKLNEAYNLLESAISLDPSVRERALKDADLNDLL